MQPLTTDSIEGFDALSQAVLKAVRGQPWATDAETGLDEGCLTISIAAAHPDVGDLGIWAEPHEVTVAVGGFFAMHFPTYAYETDLDDEAMSDEPSDEAAAEAARAAIEFVTDLLADTLVLRITRHGENVVDADVEEPGDGETPEAEGAAQAGFKTTRYRWSGPID